MRVLAQARAQAGAKERRARAGLQAAECRLELERRPRSTGQKVGWSAERRLERRHQHQAAQKPRYVVSPHNRYHSHFGSRYLTRADAVTQAFLKDYFVCLR